ncbi:cytochrome P450 [Actinokineospora sp. PR83]|uniref:cytochrome P450 n=1 Tax=Actinokineospora sp. PR83 TaxID=2884908 RepID=UPI001F46229D|nr:cytochrome P450 [Actinokineospora sp. PR83]MCG8914515.1 cytochrome P450 [Actinokineospora sp. PR83]
MSSTAPVYRPDIYARSAILDPYPHYARMRELGPVVRVPKQGAYAVVHHAACRQVLLDDSTFRSGHGVGLNPVVNRLSRGTTLNSDGAEHERRRTALAARLTPKSLRSMREEVQRRADDVVAAAVRRGLVDGVADIAEALPTSFVPDLIGWPADGREHLLRWAAATFDTLGPPNARTVRAAPRAIAMMRFARSVVRRRAALPGSMGADLLEKADRGEMRHGECPALMIDYLAPSLDTTISAIASALLLLGRDPRQWAALKADRSLVPNAVNEVVRVESPLRAFARYVRTDASVGETDLPAGSRVIVVYASANRDERVWDDPTAFDITRDATAQLGFGQGAHGCAGQGLARLETQAILRSLLDRVDRIEVVGEPVWGLNNIIHKLDRLPLRLVAA